MPEAYDAVQESISGEEDAAMPGTTDNATVENGTAENGTTVNGTTVNGITENGTTDNGITENGTIAMSSRQRRDLTCYGLRSYCYQVISILLKRHFFEHLKPTAVRSFYPPSLWRKKPFVRTI